MKKYTAKRIMAIIGVALIAVMVIATLVVAIIDKNGLLFRSFLVLDIALPLALWIFIWAYGAMTNKHTVASFDLNLDGGASEEEDNAGKTGSED